MQAGFQHLCIRIHFYQWAQLERTWVNWPVAGCLLDIFLLNRKAAEHKYDSSIWISAKFLYVNFCLCRWTINGRFLTIYTANHQFDPSWTDIRLLADWLCHMAKVPSGFSDNVNMLGNFILQQRQKEKSWSEIMLYDKTDNDQLQYTLLQNVKNHNNMILSVKYTPVCT